MAVSELQTPSTRERSELVPDLPPVVWPEPSPLEDWWHRIMHTDHRSKGSRR